MTKDMVDTPPEGRRPPGGVDRDPATGLNPEAVRAFLLDHPAFLTDDPDFMAAFLTQAAKAMGENVSSLQGVMVARAAQAARDAEANRQDMIEAARANMEVMVQMRATVLTVLEADDISDLAALVAGPLAEMLEVDSAFLAIERAEDFDPYHDDALRTLPNGSIAAWTGGVVLLRPADERMAHLHDPDSDIASEAIAPFLLADGRAGALVFGAADPERYTPEHGGDMLGFLAAVVARHIDRLNAHRVAQEAARWDA